MCGGLGGWFWVLSPSIYAIHMVLSCYFQKCMRHSNNHTFQIQHPDSHCFRMLHSHNNNTTFSLHMLLLDNHNILGVFHGNLSSHICIQLV